MYQLIDKLVGEITADATLTGLANVSLNQQPDNPKMLSKLAVVLDVDGGEDELGLHGAASNPMIKIDVWGYYGRNNTEVENCYKVMDCLDALILKKMETSDGGKTLRWRNFTGWQKLDGGDVRQIRYQAVYSTRYWSMNRINAITG
jgi:hypothetical protein